MKMNSFLTTSIIGICISAYFLDNVKAYTKGSEFRINTYTQNEQSGIAPVIESDSLAWESDAVNLVASNGTDFMVTWQSYDQDGNGYEVYGQRISGTDGSKLGSEFLINTFTTGGQYLSSVSSNGADYLVAWTSYNQDGSKDGVYGQRISGTDGSKVGSAFQINTYTLNNQWMPTIASNGTDYLVTWASDGQDGELYGVYGQRISGTDGSKLGSEFRINTYTPYKQWESSVASNGTDYLVTWMSWAEDGDAYGVYAQRISGADGSKMGSEFQINTNTVLHQVGPSIATNGTNYLVIWQSYGQDGSGYGVYGQRISGIDGSKLGSEFLINTFTTGNQAGSSLTSNGIDYLVTWESGDESDVYGQWISGMDGSKFGSEFLINTYTTNTQFLPSVASNGTNFFAVYSSGDLEDRGSFDMYGTMFFGETPVIPEPISLILFGLASTLILFKNYLKKGVN